MSNEGNLHGFASISCFCVQVHVVSMRATQVRKRTITNNRSSSLYDSHSEEPASERLRSKEYDPTCHFIVIGVLCVIIVITVLITTFYAPPPPKQSHVSRVINHYLKGTVLYELNFDAPPGFIEYAVQLQDENPNALQNVINSFYGDSHSLIIENNGWKISEKGLICRHIGCGITIQLINTIQRIRLERDTVWISIAFGISGDEQIKNELGTAMIWVDSSREISIDDHDRDALNTNKRIVNAFQENTKAVSQETEWELDISQWISTNQLYFHALVLEGDNRIKQRIETQSREPNLFSLLGIKMTIK